MIKISLFRGMRLGAVVLLFPASMLLRQQAAAQSAPPVDIRAVGANQVQVVWPPGTNFNVLEEIFGFEPTNAWREVSDPPSILGDLYAVRRDASNGAAFYRLATRGVPGVSTPPDPTNTATVLPPNSFNDLGSSTAFLYAGPNPIQIGVAPGTIDPVRSSILRGKVKKRDNHPLPGVRVAILDHSEFGYTFTRADGMFDLAVNASTFTLDFQAIGYCPVQRQETAPQQDFRTLKDIVMAAMDPVANPIAFGSNAPAQWASSTRQTDAAGGRAAKVFFPAGTCANVLLPDGSLQPCGGLTIRITEFTVGTNGQAAMPAPLPGTSAYTYCAEFSGDEAVSVGASRIRFNRPVWGYLENFLDLPVGTLVPNGSYDRQKAAWVPDQNGLVLQILGVSNGVAQVDLTGTGLAADSNTLAAVQFTTAELQQLASTYAVSNTLWRVPMAHFTAVDWNYGGIPINKKSPNTPGDPPRPNPCDNCPPNYGTVNFTSQVFDEVIPLVGVPMSLHYSSARVPDYRVLAKAVVPLFDSNSPPADLLRVEVHSQIAGVVNDLPYIINPTPLQTATISWDGYDAYGRFVGGSRNGSIEVDFVYPFLEYGLRAWEQGIRAGVVPSKGGKKGTGSSIEMVGPIFADYGQVTGGHGHADGEVVGAFFRRTFTIPDHRALGLGGWSLTSHHLYDPVQHYLYLGDGRILKPDRLGNGVGTWPGLDTFAGLNPNFEHAAIGPDGTLFMVASLPAFGAYGGGTTIRFFKRSPNGEYTVLSGAGYGPGVVDPIQSGWAAVEGHSALNSDVGGYATVIRAGPDGSICFRTSANTIARIDRQGIVRLVLGPGPDVYAPDGTLARDATCHASSDNRTSLAVGKDGTVYYDDSWTLNGTNYTFIRRVAPDGRIYTVVGQAGPQPLGESFHKQLGKPVLTAQVSQIRDLAVGPDGTLYVSPEVNGPGIYKITPAGMVESVLWEAPFTDEGFNSPFENDEGIKAAQPFGNNAGYAPYSMQIGPDGSLVFLENYGPAFLWAITPDGILHRLAGRWNYDQRAKSVLYGANPLETVFTSQTSEVAISPDGSLTLIDPLFFNASQGVPRIGTSLSGFVARDFQIAAEDASEVYLFDAHGNHLRTLDGLTGATNWVFSYDANNLVTDLRDANGLVTHIDRTAAGQPTTIVGPYGQRTTLALDGNGFLNGVTNPVGEATLVTNTKGGLLTSITRPLKDTDTVTYDADGRVTQVRDPVGGGYDQSRTDLGNQVSVQSITTLTNLELRQLALLPSGDTYISALAPNHSVTTTTLYQGGGEGVGFADGSVGHYEFAGDPRFPKQTRLLSYQFATVPDGSAAGLQQSISVDRSATLSDPLNPFAIASISNRTTFNGQVYTTTYDGTNRLWVTTSPEGRKSAAGLDGQGRVIHQEEPGQTPLDFSYDTKGRVGEVEDTASLMQRRTFLSYDSLGRLETVTDPLGRTNRYSYDAAGRLQHLTLADGQVADFAIDAELRVTSVMPPGQPPHRFEYSSVGLLTNYVPPVVSGLKESVTYQYDPDRRLSLVSLPDGQSIAATRGLGGRIEQLSLGAGVTMAYAYSLSSGLLTNIVSTTGDGLRFGYAGSILTTSVWSGTVTGTVSQTLNADLLPATQTINASPPINYSYDRDALLIQAGNITLTRNAANGYVNATALGTVTDARQFDDRGLLTNYVARVNNTPIWSMALSYDPVDRLTNKVETINGVTRTFGYVRNLSGRLKEVWLDGALATTYTYDANGSRLTRNAEVATYDAQDRLQTYSGATFSWSPNGNLHARTAAGQTTTYAYDARGALSIVAFSSGQKIDYLIDPAGRRVGKKVNGSLVQGLLYQSFLQPVAELDTTGQVIAAFVYGSKPNIPDYMIKGTNTFRLLSDERGSVKLVVNILDGSIGQQLDYDEFGRVLQDTAPGFQPFGFAGGLYDPQTGWVRFGARDYDPETGRWTAREPALFASGTLNLYSYAANDPVSLVDFEGKHPTSPGRPPRSVINDANRSMNELLQLDRPINSAQGWRMGDLLERPIVWYRDEEAQELPVRKPAPTAPPNNPSPATATCPAASPPSGPNPARPASPQP